MEIQDIVAIVTGGASGLGEATVNLLVENGAKAAILDMNEDKGQALVEKLGSDNVIFVKTNVSSESEAQYAINQAVEQFGYVNALVNCAGITSPKKVLNRENKANSLDSFNKEIQVNLVGTYNMIRLAVEKMATNTPNEDGERGVIVNTASVAAFDGQIGQPGYSASKGGITAMTLPIARELARQGIRVMTIAPGLFLTPMAAGATEEQKQALESMIPFPKRFGKASEYAKLVQSIIEIPMLNGETIRLDGAIRMQPK
ncbi:3-hydroxyacyl-CoA dehydrogenase [Neobacillus niacini]|uniref:3-hydroxyacyl-CoA dehydrogenase n=1 Tax=Neobacillus niacini TaxID=86668 RepID=UPI002FFF7FB8